jgi:hypothetical protein
MSKPKSAYSPLDAKVESTEPLVCTYILLQHAPEVHPLITKATQSNEAAKWIRMKKITYTDPAGEIRTWEMAERQVGEQSSLIAQAGGLLTLSSRPVRQIRSATASASSLSWMIDHP